MKKLLSCAFDCVAVLSADNAALYPNLAAASR
jgi:hypothetical protein